MTKEERTKTVIQIKNLILQITALISKLENESTPEPKEMNNAKMLTIKECSDLTGLSQHTVRQIALQNKIPYMRAGAGKNGKILIPEKSLIKYISN